jgi:hypothetical protein
MSSLRFVARMHWPTPRPRSRPRSVDLDHKGMAGAIRELESEDEVGDEADLVHGSLVRELHAQRQRAGFA